jgi:hypothetical protein
VAWAVGAAVVLGGSCVAYEALDARVTRSAAAGAWRLYGACLTGEPLAAGQHADEKLRAIDLGLVSLTDEQRGDWPARCTHHASALTEQLSAVSRRDPRWAEAARLARLAAAPVDPSRVDPSLVDGLSDALAALPLPSADTTSEKVPAPPPAARATLGRDGLVPLVTAGPASLAFVDPPSGAAPTLAWSGSPARVCRFDSPLTTVRCIDAAAVPKGAETIPVPADDGVATIALRVLFTQDAPAGILRVDDGARVSDDWNAPAFVRADGDVWTLAPGRGGSLLRRGSEELSIAIPGAPSASVIAADAVVWTDAPGRLRARDLAPDGALGPIVDIGSLPPGEHVLTACRGTDHGRSTLAVRVATGQHAKTAFRVDGAWSTPVESPRAERPASASCAGARLALVWFEHDVVRRIACTAGGCTRDEASLGAPWDLAEVDRAAVDLSGRVLIVRHASRSSAIGAPPVEALVARFAPVAELASAAERVLVADSGHGGVDPASVQALARGDAALVVVGARDGKAWGMRFAADSDAGPIGP